MTTEIAATRLAWVMTTTRRTSYRAEKRGSIWHIARVHVDEQQLSYDGTIRKNREGDLVLHTRWARLCQPPKDEFWCREWKLGERGDWIGSHPLAPKVFESIVCEKCFATLGKLGLSTDIVEPSVPTEQSELDLKHANALKSLQKTTSAHSGPPQFDRTHPAEIRSQLDDIRAVDADMAAELARFADDFEAALRIILSR